MYIKTGGGLSIYIKKVYKLLPDILVSYLMLLIYRLYKGSIVFDINFIFDAFIELSQSLILVSVGDAHNVLNGVMWFVSALLLLYPIIIYFIDRRVDIYKNIIAPYSVVFIYLFFYNNWKHVDFGLVWLGQLNGGLLIAIAGLNLGVTVYHISEYINKKYIIKTSYKLCLEIIEIICFCLVIYNAINYRQTVRDFINIILITLFVTISFSIEGPIKKTIGNNIIIKYLGRLSWPIYVYQMVAMTIMGNYSSYLNIDSKYLWIIYLLILYVIILVSRLILNIIKIFINRLIRSEKKQWMF